MFPYVDLVRDRGSTRNIRRHSGPSGDGPSGYDRTGILPILLNVQIPRGLLRMNHVPKLRREIALNIIDHRGITTEEHVVGLWCELN